MVPLVSLSLGCTQFIDESISKGRKMVMIILEGGVLLTGKFSNLA